MRKISKYFVFKLLLFCSLSCDTNCLELEGKVKGDLLKLISTKNCNEYNLILFIQRDSISGYDSMTIIFENNSVFLKDNKQLFINFENKDTLYSEVSFLGEKIPILIKIDKIINCSDKSNYLIRIINSLNYYSSRFDLIAIFNFSEGFIGYYFDNPLDSNIIIQASGNILKECIDYSDSEFMLLQ